VVEVADVQDEIRGESAGHLGEEAFRVHQQAMEVELV